MVKSASGRIGSGVDRNSLRARSKPWLVFAVLAASVAALLWGLDWYRHRFVRADRDLFRFLPQSDATIFYVNVAALRRAGMLQVFAGTAAAEEADYRSFVRETRFDYRTDIDAIAGAADGQQVFFVVRGRFDWNKLRAYAAAHGGSCTGELCDAPTSKAGRWASFLPVQPDVMALALSANRMAVEAVRPPGHALAEEIPERPVWARVSQSVLKDPASLPVAVRIFAISLQFANPVVLSARPADAHSEEFTLELDAQCASAAMAEGIRNQLEIDTKMLKLELAREHAQANAADLTGLLTSGSFQVVGKRVIATWPIREELLKSLR
jgi:hypothetical protein